MTDAPPDVSVLIVSWNTRDLTLACLESLAGAAGSISWDAWVVDNASADDSVAAIRARYPATHVIARTDNAGFAAANNEGIATSCGRYVLLLNSDTVMMKGALEALVRFADAHPRAAIVGAMLLNADGTFQAGPTPFPSIWNELLSATGIGARLFHAGYPSLGARASDQVQQADYVGGACLLARRTAIDEVGGLDDRYFMYSEEIDWCWRMRRRAWEVWFTPAARVVHLGGQSTRQVRDEMLRALYRSKVRFFRLHRGRLAAACLAGILVAATHARLIARRLAGQSSAGRALTWRDLADDPRTNTSA
jgi:N-acetylglucosaminyl-diphospho-decaprenol L-rhamnosyltransferase